MSLLTDRGSVTEYVLITILIGISVLFVAQRYGITLRDKTSDASAQLDASGVTEADDAGGGSSRGGVKGAGDGAASGGDGALGRGGSGTARDGTVASGGDVSSSGGAARGAAAPGGASDSTASGRPSGSSAEDAPGSAARTSADLTVEEMGTLPESDEDDGAIDVLGFRLTLGTAMWLGLLVVAVGFVMIQQVSKKQKKIGKEAEAAARLRKGRT